MEISSNLQTILSAPKEADAAEKKKIDGASPSLCSRIFSAVKNALATLLYFATFCQVDLRKKPVMFDGQSNFHKLSALPKNEKETNVFKAEVKDAMVAAYKTTYPTFDLIHQIAQKAVDDRLVEEAAQTLISAFKGGISPVEYKFTCPSKEEGLTLTVFAPICMKKEKLPKLDKRSVEGIENAFTVKAAWKEDKEALALPKDAKEDTKARTIDCFSHVFSLSYQKLPLTRTEEIADLEKKISSLNTQLGLTSWIQAEEAVPGRLQALRERHVDLTQRLQDLGKSGTAPRAQGAPLSQPRHSLEKVEVKIGLNIACKHSNPLNFLPEKDITAISNFLYRLRKDAQSRGSNVTFKLSPRPPVDGTKETANRPAYFIIEIHNDTHEDLTAISKIAERLFIPTLFSEKFSIETYINASGKQGIIGTFRGAENFHFLCGRLTDPALAGKPYASEASEA